MGLWQHFKDELKKAREEQQKKDEARLEKADRFVEKSDQFFKGGIAYAKRPKDDRTADTDNRNARVNELIDAPTELTRLSDEELELLRLTTENDLDILRRDFSEQDREALKELKSADVEHKLSNPLLAPFVDMIVPRKKLQEKQEQIDNRKLLLKLIAHQKDNRKHLNRPPEPAVVAPTPPPSKDELRAKLIAQIDQLRIEEVERLKSLKDRNATEDEVRRWENMYGDAIREKEQQVIELLK